MIFFFAFPISESAVKTNVSLLEECEGSRRGNQHFLRTSDSLGAFDPMKIFTDTKTDSEKLSSRIQFTPQ